jgi:hypothetical protein
LIGLLPTNGYIASGGAVSVNVLVKEPFKEKWRCRCGITQINKWLTMVSYKIMVLKAVTCCSQLKLISKSKHYDVI